MWIFGTIQWLLTYPILVVYLKRKRKSAEEPVVDDYMYYGDEGDDYTYGETRVTDSNDYYDDDD